MAFLFREKWNTYQNYIYKKYSKIAKLPPIAEGSGDPLILSTFAKERVFSIDEVDRIRNQIFSDQNLWVRRNKILFSLGVPSYFYLSDGSALKTEIDYWRPLLMGKYGWVLDKVKSHMKSKLPPDVRVEYADNKGVPGFQIFEINAYSSRVSPEPHLDQQFLAMDFESNGAKPNYQRTMSFTIAIELPKLGSGLCFLNLPKDKPFWAKLLPRSLWYLLLPKYFVPYDLGSAVFQPGTILHFISPHRPSYEKSPEWRITLQGHGIYIENERLWLLYW